jgi:hypothetical protein
MRVVVRVKGIMVGIQIHHALLLAFIWLIGYRPNVDRRLPSGVDAPFLGSLDAFQLPFAA